MVTAYPYRYLTGRGCGAMHQTGWTGLVAKLLDPDSVHEARADLLL